MNDSRRLQVSGLGVWRNRTDNAITVARRSTRRHRHLRKRLSKFGKLPE